MANLNRLEYFVAIVEAGTITKAAAQLGVSKAVVSKQLQALEHDVGATLVLRNARNQSLTQEGQTLFEAAQASLAQVEEALENIRSGHDAPSGVLRVAAPLDLGIRFIAPFVARFQADYPAVTVDLRLSDTRHDPVAARFDIAYRVGWLTDSSNLTRKLVDFDQVLVAAPRLLQRIGPLTDPADLNGLPFIAHHMLSSPLRWHFTHHDRGARDIVFDAAISVDVTLGIKAMCLAGAGLAVLPSFEIQGDLARGDLVACLPDWRLPSGGIYSVYPPTPYRSAATRRFDREFARYFVRQLA